MKEKEPPVLCPVHNVAMKKMWIHWGIVEADGLKKKPDDVFYGGCCIEEDENGTIEWCYVCPECEKETGERAGQASAYVFRNGELTPFAEE